MMCVSIDEALAIVADMACPAAYNLFSNLISKRYEFIDENYKEPYFPDDSSEIVQKGYLLYHFLENNCIEEITGFNYFEFTNSIEQLRVFLESNDNDLPSELQGYSIEILFHLLLEYECWLIKDKWNNKQLTPTDFIGLQEKVSNAALIIQQRKANDDLIAFSKIMLEHEKNTAKSYKKVGTIEAVEKIIEENREWLHERGGKARLIRTIWRAIESGDIIAPSIPVEKTVASWINNWIEKNGFSPIKN